MENIFGFDYVTTKLQNLNGTDSRFGVVYGQEGNIISCKKDSYTLVKTEDVDTVAREFINRGYTVTPFIKSAGEKIGLNILWGVMGSKVGDKTYRFHLHIPNDGTGMGYLKLFELRWVCTNGMTRSLDTWAVKNIKIPHTWNYLSSLKLVESVIENAVKIITQANEQDERLNDQTLTKNELTYELNKWFYEVEMPPAHKKEMTFTKFREILYSDPEKLKCLNRYTELMKARNKELEYNRELNLATSKYTVIATITNYLSRRIEKSNSRAPQETQFERAQSKIEKIYDSMLV